MTGRRDGANVRGIADVQRRAWLVLALLESCWDTEEPERMTGGSGAGGGSGGRGLWSRALALVRLRGPAPSEPGGPVPGASGPCVSGPCASDPYAFGHSHRSAVGASRRWAVGASRRWAVGAARSGRRGARDLVLCVGVLLALGLSVVQPAAAEGRLALVVGNNDYATARLTNPRSDAELMAAALTSVGFTVTTVLDARLDSLRGAVVEFGRRLRATGSVGLFYYAGHGVQVDGENFLIPIDADISDASEVALTSVSLSEVLRAMDHGASSLNIAVLDACRNNPFVAASGRSIGQGLAPVQAPSGTLIAFATGPGQVALDGAGHNSPYSAALAAEVPSAGIGIEEVFRRARRKVLEVSNGRQTPWEHSSLTAEFFFRPKVAEPEASSRVSERPKAEAVEEQARLAELGDWLRIRASNDKALLRKHIQRYPDGVFTELAQLRLSRIASAEAAVAAAEADPWAWLTSDTPLPAPTGLGEAEKLYEKAARLELLASAKAAGADMSGMAGMAGGGAAGDRPDPKAVVDLYQRAAEMGLPAAMFSLAKAYDKGLGAAGQGVPRDLAAAARWYGKAARQGHAGAMAALGVMYEFGDGVGKDLAMAAKLYRKAGESGDAQGLTSLGFLNQTGKGMPRNWLEARKLYTRAADKGAPRAMFNLALMLIRGEGGKGDLPQAVRLLKSAAEKGHAGAMRELAFLHDEGRGLPKDPKAAAERLIASYKAGNKDPWLDIRRRPDVWSMATKREVQRQLAAAGLYAGRADGLINAGTRKALDHLASGDHD